MEELRRAGRRYRRQRRALEATYAALVPLILEARRPDAEGRAPMTLRAIAEATGLTFARIHQIEKEAQRG